MRDHYRYLLRPRKKSWLLFGCRLSRLLRAYRTLASCNLGCVVDRGCRRTKPRLPSGPACSMRWRPMMRCGWSKRSDRWARLVQSDVGRLNTPGSLMHWSRVIDAPLAIMIAMLRPLRASMVSGRSHTVSAADIAAGRDVAACRRDNRASARRERSTSCGCCRRSRRQREPGAATGKEELTPPPYLRRP
jgi:hypothetical protein